MSTILSELPPVIGEKVAHWAKKTGRTEADCILEAIEDWLIDLEDIRDAEQALEDIRAGKSIPRLYSEVRKELALDD